MQVLRSRVYRGPKPPSRTRCLCLCDCGRKFFAWQADVRSGNTKSCGCLRNKRTKKKAEFYSEPYSMKAHPAFGMYNRWLHIHQRCGDATHEKFHRYGGRGIYVCERWKSFELFLADMGMSPFKGASIDRKDNDGPYSPENCRWATAKEQANNRSKQSGTV